MKLKCLRYSKLGNEGDEIEITGKQSQELILSGICEELKPAAEKKQTKGGKKPSEPNLEAK
jgi:hypothetical protein